MMTPGAVTCALSLPLGWARSDPTNRRASATIKASKGTDDPAVAFQRALLAIARARDDDGIDPPKLGRWLARNKGRVVDGNKIVGELDKHSKQSLWALQDTSQGACLL